MNVGVYETDYSYSDDMQTYYFCQNRGWGPSSGESFMRRPRLTSV